MSLSTVRTQMKTMLESVSGIGEVYDYKRYSNDLTTYKNLFVEGSKVTTWEIIRDTFSMNVHGGSGGVEDRTHNFIIRGFYSLNDKLASEKTFQDLVDTVIEVFRDDPTLSGVANIVNMPVEGSFSMEKLGNVLCHKVEINISISERNRF